jgi:agmatinase
VQIGPARLLAGRETFAWMREQGMRWHTMQEVWERGVPAVMADAVAEALDGADRLYVSVDIDVLDPGFAPGTGTPEPGGMHPADLLRVVRELARRTDVVALDVVEVSPPYDSADLTVNNAHRVVYEFLAGSAARRRDAGLPGARTVRDVGVSPGSSPSWSPVWVRRSRPSSGTRRRAPLLAGHWRPERERHRRSGRRAARPP